MRLIDADALIEDFEHDIAIDEDILGYEGSDLPTRENAQYDKDFKQNAIDWLMRTPTIKTKQVKYYDDEEQVWKIGEVIVDE